MAFLPLTLSALLSAANPTFAPPDMACRFDPGNSAPTLWISVRPQEEIARPGLFKVRLWIGGKALSGSVTALTKTVARDVVVRGITRDRTTWLIAIRDNGTAFLRRKGAAADAPVTARTGSCAHYQNAFEVWLAS